MPIIRVDAFKCNVCGYVWISKIFTRKNPPISCAKCKTPYWNRPKQKSKEKSEP